MPWTLHQTLQSTAPTRSAASGDRE